MLVNTNKVDLVNTSNEGYRRYLTFTERFLF